MTRSIVSLQAVTEAANDLVAQGLEPTLVLVQSRIGGSYTTVKRHLDAWKLARTQANAADTNTPAAILAKGQELARAVWMLADRTAQSDVQLVKEEARAEVAVVRSELAGATQEIARLEAVEADQAATVEAQQVKVRELELSLAQAQALASRVPELERTLAQVQVELDAARRQATDRAVEAGRLAGEAEALRGQVRELMAVIKPQ